MNKKIEITNTFRKHLNKLKKEHPKLGFKVWDLVLSINETPYKGIGKPEALKELPGIWSRRINQKHRLTYKLNDQTVILISCYGHYGDR